MYPRSLIRNMARIHCIFFICCMAVFPTRAKVSLEVDRPWLRVQLAHRAVLECCYHTDAASVQTAWLMHGQPTDGTAVPVPVPVSDRVSSGYTTNAGVTCGTLTFAEVKLADSGLYRCWFNITGIFTPGTYLQIYEPLKKTINLSEKTKDSLLMAEGMLLFLCVLVPSAMLLRKSKQLQALQQRKAKREEENIYQGLNLDDCDKPAGLYHDLVAIVQEEIHLENP
ncbi:B-cell antigen receptor complex-associated protein alpha chain [Phycodurus eques]|uniref:B-cell antigen receptor complex-associated protein alpha chain n=1 Tax=Phycodurus eques TaxID=693459 RepID=UPI002ACE1D4C|nr:B-cell antigen receptor complex-associated protein alpha chain [Phycodurus eques]